MKRITIVAMIFSALLTLYSCQTTSEPQETLPEMKEGLNTEETGTEEIPEETETEEIPEETETEESVYEPGPNDPANLYDWYWWDRKNNKIAIYPDVDSSINDVDEYKAFCQYPPFQKILPPNFLGYDQLSPLGQFQYLLIQDHNAYKCYFNYYDEGDQYPEGRFTFNINIKYLSNNDSHDIEDEISKLDQNKVFEENDKIGDMTVTTIGSDSSKIFWIVKNNMLYRYSEGHLTSVRLIVDDYDITIAQSTNYIQGESKRCYFKDYAPAEPNFITLLLEGAEYEEVANSFRQMIATEAE